MFELKPLSKEAVPRALEKAERYRVLNEPAEAESICLDILEAEPDNQEALVVLCLALTDQFETGAGVQQATQVVSRLRDDYERAYYSGIVSERQAKAWVRRSGPADLFAAYERFREAMRRYEEAEAIRPPGNDDAILRWNTCARILMQNPQLQPRPAETGGELPLE